jgi:hypothetical protein
MTLDEDKENLLDFSSIKKEAIIDSLIESCKLPDSIDIAEDVYKDTLIDQWGEKLPSLSGSKKLIKKILRNPVNNEKLLYSRQKSFKRYDIDFDLLNQYEDDVLWIYKLDEELKNNNLVDILYPSTFIISYINFFEPVLECYHIYKIYYIPLTAMIYPIMSLFAPLYYLNNYMKFNISIKTYFNMLYKFVKMLFTFNSTSLKTNLIKIVTILIYAFLFIYNIYQTIEYSRMLFNVKSSINKKIQNLNIFLKQACHIINTVPKDIVKNFVKIEPPLFNQLRITNVYTLWKNNNVKDMISQVLINLYTIDIIYNISNVIFTPQWCLTEYDTKTVMWNTRNPLLGLNQTANPVDFRKNIIITGPNAAGKTTYVKSILSNIILSQTFGISNSMKSKMVLYDTIVSLMRISDVLGCKSYFEAEAEYCKTMISKANELSKQNKRGLFLMDEPMHSTPPTEGMSTAYAVAEYIGNLKNMSIILTTHFHKITLLEETYPDKFINLSVDAIKTANGFLFPYKVKRGYSTQCIAIDLLSSKDFPEIVINSAINMKNKICNELIR